jgi:His/Glu/Gln/Arg/opine family amino acid ABC transporter permease subunit
MDAIFGPSRFINFLLGNLPLLLQGLEMTLAVSAVSLAAALAWGLVLSLPRIFGSPWASRTALCYIELVRNSPLLIIIYLVYFGLPTLGLVFSPLACGVIAIAGQHGGFLAEIYRGAVASVDRGQWEGAKALGLDRRRAFVLVILPQALRLVLPSVGNQLLILIKDSAAVAGIGIVELTLAGKIIIERSAASYEVFAVIALIFVAINLAFGGLLRLLEWRMGYGR